MEYTVPDRLLVSGCSFTTSGSDVASLIENVVSWPDPLVKEYNIKIINNLAMQGNGNTSICQGLSYVINSELRHSFPPERTLILFNITGLDRIDLMVPNSHPDINTLGSWHRVFPFAWITSGGWLGQRSGNSKKLIDSLQKNMGWEQVILSNCLTIINLVRSLESLGYRYHFMLMDDQILKDAPEFFVEFIKTKSDHWITFGEHLSMHAYGDSLGVLQDDNFHLSIDGNIKISKVVSQKIARYFCNGN